MAVTFRANAAAFAGIPQGLAGIGKARLVPPAMFGPPKVPAAFRVSTTRQGVTEIKSWGVCAQITDEVRLKMHNAAATEPPRCNSIRIGSGGEQ
jgi:hypothetical protein